MGLFYLITQKWLVDLVGYAQREPWSVKDPRIKPLVERVFISGESRQADIAALPASLMLELRRLVRRVKREIAHVRQPTIIVHPRRDHRASMRNVNYFQSMLPALTETLVVDDSYHLVTLDRQRQLVLGRMLHFVSRVGLGTAHHANADAAVQPAT
jgi:carboxylesterase